MHAAKINVGEQSGTLYNFDIVNTVIEGIKLYQSIKKDGFTVADWLAQGRFFYMPNSDIEST